MGKHLGLINQIVERADQVLMHTYGRIPVAFVRGQGCRMWDQDGRVYLDFLAGIAVTALGHSHPRVVESLKDQAEKLLHTSNLYHIEHQIALAELLVAHSFADKVFFCNSGTEANEGAIKLARRYSIEKFGPERTTIHLYEKQLSRPDSRVPLGHRPGKISKGFWTFGSRFFLCAF